MKLIDRMLDARNDSGHGPWADAQGGWVDPKPYVAHYHPGIFEGHDGSAWIYFEAPEDVRLEWLSSVDESVMNQQFFVDLCQETSKMLGGETSAKKDVRRDFHLFASQYESGPIKPYDGCTPRHADYLRRMTGQYSKQVWRSFLGYRLIESNIFHEAYGVRAKVRRYVDALRNPGNVPWMLLKQDLEDVTSLMIRHGFRPLDFTKDLDAFGRLTASYGVPDDAFDLPIQLQTQRLQEPIHGKSIITPRYGEMSMYALTPDENIDLRDPRNHRSRWASAMYQPESDVAMISIRGQIRSIGASDNLLDVKGLKNTNESADLHTMNVADLINLSRELVIEDRMPMIDNVEIIVGSVLERAETAERPFVRAARDRGMRANLLVDRQAIALLSTLPTYPRHVSRIPKGNGKRPPLTNVMMPGALAYSGIFRANKPAGRRGILVGLGDVGYQFPEIFIDTEGASREGKSPTMLVSGRPGAGKTMQLQQMAIQGAYMGLPVVFLNPKSTGTLKAMFDHIGGATISLSMEYLEDNPGLLDPVFFLQDRSHVAALLADAITIAMRMNEDSGTHGSQRRTRLLAEIRERAFNMNNLTSGHILFGRQGVSEPLSDAGVLDFVRDKMASSPFWRALVSINHESSLTRTLKESNALLVEWTGGMELPDSDEDRPTDAQVDTMLSVTTVFRYAAAKVEGTGGMLIVDESWVLRTSREARNLLERAGREWREANIMLILGTQRIREWAVADSDAADLTSFISRFLFMAISENDDKEMAAYFKLTGLERTPENERYIVKAGFSRGPDGRVLPPRGYLKDTVHDWSGGIICGPWPKDELNIGRTDIEAKRSRTAGNEVQSLMDMTGAAAAAGETLEQEW